MTEVKLACFQCGAEVTVNLEYDSDYGADADGRRGVAVWFCYGVDQSCDCDITDSERAKLIDDAKRSEDGGGYADYWADMAYDAMRESVPW